MQKLKIHFKAIIKVLIENTALDLFHKKGFHLSLKMESFSSSTNNLLFGCQYPFLQEFFIVGKVPGIQEPDADDVGDQNGLLFIPLIYFQSHY